MNFWSSLRTGFALSTRPAPWLLLISLLVGFALTASLPGCGGGSVAVDPDASTGAGDDETGSGDSMGDGGSTGGSGDGATDGGSGSDGGSDGGSTDAGGDDGTGAGDDVITLTAAEAEEILVLLAPGVDDEGGALDGDTTSDELPFFGEDPDLYAEVDLSAAETLAVEEVLDAGAAAESTSSAQLEPPIVHGFLGGLWEPGAGESSGLLRGRWFTSEKTPQGALRGEWTDLQDLDGLRIGRFHAKYVDEQGAFAGFLRGRWAIKDSGGGVFLGRWFDEAQLPVGVLRGAWIAGPDGAGGSFEGRWAAFDICAESQTLPLAESDAVSIAAFDRILANSDLTIEPLDVSEGQREEVDAYADVKVQGGTPCTAGGQPFGFLRGTHTAGTGDGPGTFTGLWIDSTGEVAGSVRGIFGPPALLLALDPEAGSDPSDGGEGSDGGPLVEQTITIEPDDYADGADLTEADAHVTLSTTLDDGRIVELFFISASDDGQGYAPTGERVFGHANVPFFNEYRRLRMDFLTPASHVQIAFAGGTGNGTEIGRLLAYDAADNLLDEYVTEPRAAGEVEIMSITRDEADIAWAVAYVAEGDGSFGRMDELSFTVLVSADSAQAEPDDGGSAEADLGTVLGEVLNLAGQRVGHVRGHHAVSDRGLGILRGRYYDLNGNSRGFLRGRWHTPGDSDHGSFVGVWSGIKLPESP